MEQQNQCRRGQERRSPTFTIHARSASNGEIIGALLDIARGGMRLAMRQAIEEGERLSIELVEQGRERAMMQIQCVCRWCQEDPDAGDWEVGLAFVAPLEEHSEAALEAILRDHSF